MIILHLAGDESPYFRGETMRCAKCGRVQFTILQCSSRWRLLEADGVPYYFCPREFPPDGSRREAFAKAYERALKTIDELRRLQLNLNILAALRRLELSRSAALREVASEMIADKYPEPNRERMARRAMQAGLRVQQAEVDGIMDRIARGARNLFNS